MKKTVFLGLDFEHSISTEDFRAKKWNERDQILVTLLELQHQALLRQEKVY